MHKLRGVFAKVFVFGLFGLLILSFAVWGIGDVIRGGTSDPIVASVGDREISETEYRQAFNRAYSNLQQRFGGAFDGEMARSIGIPTQVLQQLVDRAVYDEKTTDLGMVVTDEQVREAIFNLPAFQNEAGRFDRLRYDQVLRNNQLSEAQFVASLRQDIAREQVQSALTSAAVAPDALAERLFLYSAERRVAEYLLISLVSMPETRAPEEEELAQFHQDYADSFRAPEYRSLTYLSLVPADFESEITVSEEELRQLYDTRLEELGEPERRELVQMLFDSQADAEAALEKLRAGQSFAAVAEEVTGSEPIELGEVTTNQLVPEVSEAAFAVAEGEVAGPVESPFGWHLINVMSIAPEYVPSFEEVRERLLDDARVDQAVENLIAIANQLDDTLAGGASLEEAADRLALEIRKVAAIDAEGNGEDGESAQGLPDQEMFLRTAFETEEGDESLLLETEEGGYFVIRVDGVTAPAVRPLDAVRDQVAELWTQQEREREAREKADGLAERLRAGETMEALADELETAALTTAPVTRTERDPQRTPSAELSAALFQAQLNDVVVSGSPLGPVVARLTEIVAPDPSSDAEALEEAREAATQALRADLGDLYVESLKAQYGVEVNEERIESIVVGY